MEFEIRANDILTFRNNTSSMVYMYDGELVYSNFIGYESIKSFNDDLTAYTSMPVRNMDIMKIQRPENPLQLYSGNWDEAPVVWERKNKTSSGETYEQVHIEMWTWLSENPEKKKIDYLKMKGYPYITNLCFACEQCNGVCGKCPLNEEVIGCKNGLYNEWKIASEIGDYELASKYAAIIAQLPWRGVK